MRRTPILLPLTPPAPFAEHVAITIYFELSMLLPMLLFMQPYCILKAHILAQLDTSASCIFSSCCCVWYARLCSYHLQAASRRGSSYRTAGARHSTELKAAVEVAIAECIAAAVHQGVVIAASRHSADAQPWLSC
jgi:hypothetical protein